MNTWSFTGEFNHSNTGQRWWKGRHEGGYSVTDVQCSFQLMRFLPYRDTYATPVAEEDSAMANTR